MNLVGLTGGVGMGKTTCAQMLRERGLPVCDTDDLARVVVEPGQPALREIQAAFGPGYLKPDGSLDRGRLARLVFSDTASRQRLEAILHPPIRALWRAQAASWKEQGIPVGVVVIPLLFETRAEEELTTTICVACSPATQQSRLASRGWTREQISQRVAAQWPIDRKMALANYVIWNEGAFGSLQAQLVRVLAATKGI